MTENGRILGGEGWISKQKYQVISGRLVASWISCANEVLRPHQWPWAYPTYPSPSSEKIDVRPSTHRSERMILFLLADCTKQDSRLPIHLVLQVTIPLPATNKTSQEVQETYHPSRSRHDSTLVCYQKPTSIPPLHPAGGDGWRRCSKDDPLSWRCFRSESEFPTTNLNPTFDLNPDPIIMGI